MNISWSTILTIGLQIVGFVLTRVNASNDVVAKFKALVDSAKDSGLISIKQSDKFNDLHDKLLEQFKEPPPAP